MATNAAKVDVAITGAVSYSTTTGAVPTNATSPLSGDYRDVGYISEDGVKEIRDRSTNKIVAWQNGDVVREVVTEATLAVEFVMIESNPNSIELFYGRPLDGPTGSVDIVPSATGGPRRLVVDYIDGTKYVRLFLPLAEVLEVEELTLANGEVVGYGVKITAYPDPVLGYSGKKFWSDLITP